MSSFFTKAAPVVAKVAKTVVTVAGVYTLAKSGLGALNFFWKHFGPSTELAKFGAGKGAYVVITGG